MASGARGLCRPRRLVKGASVRFTDAHRRLPSVPLQSVLFLSEKGAKETFIELPSGVEAGYEFERDGVRWRVVGLADDETAEKYNLGSHDVLICERIDD